MIYLLIYNNNRRLIVKIETNVCINNNIIIIITVVRFRLEVKYMFKIIIVNTFNHIVMILTQVNNYYLA